MMVIKNIRVHDRRTSVRIEEQLWDSLQDVCSRENLSVDQIATLISDHKTHSTSLVGAMRTFLITYFQLAAEGASPKAA